jgi:endonuclease-3 related protein
MPTLTEAYPTIARAMPAPPAEGADPDPFAALVGFAVSRSGESKASIRLQAALERAGLFDPALLASADPAEVVDLLREARLDPPIKTVRMLKRLASWYEGRRAELEGAGDEPFEFPTAWRNELAEINGVGRATADAIALHVFGAATYPVDRPVYRILYRHGWIDSTAEYEETSQRLIDAADADPRALAVLARGRTEIGKRFCKPAAPACARCPLQSVLPPDGPIAMNE